MFVLGHSLKYVAKPGHIFRFWGGGPNTRLLLVVQQWTTGSHVEFWIGSHKVELPVVKPNNQQRKVMDPLPESSRDALVEAGCDPRDLKFPKGAL